MTEIREGMQDASLSRRDFLKAAAGAVVVAAAAGVALPDINASKAFAASAAPLSGAYAAPGTYTVTANLYVDKRDSPIGKNAYVTNPGNPPFNKPTSPVANNATLVVAEGGAKLLTVPIVNSSFGVLEIASASQDGLVRITEKKMGKWVMPNFLWSSPYDERVVSLTFDVTNFAGGSATATFSPSAEYASFPLYKGRKTWDLHLVADLGAA